MFGTNSVQEACTQTGVFERSTLSGITLPATLKVIGANTFKNCKRLGSIEFPQ